MIGSATTAARKVVSSSTLIGPFEFERERSLNLYARSNSSGPTRIEDETTLRAVSMKIPHSYREDPIHTVKIKSAEFMNKFLF